MLRVGEEGQQVGCAQRTEEVRVPGGEVGAAGFEARDVDRGGVGGGGGEGRVVGWGGTAGAVELDDVDDGHGACGLWLRFGVVGWYSWMDGGGLLGRSLFVEVGWCKKSMEEWNSLVSARKPRNPLVESDDRGCRCCECIKFINYALRKKGIRKENFFRHA